MARKKQSYSEDHLLYRQGVKVRRALFWMITSMFLFLVSLFVYIFAPLFQAIVLFFAVLVIILTFGLILLSKDFMKVFSDTAEGVVAFIEKVSITMMVIFIVLFVLNVFLYLWHRKNLIKMMQLAVTYSDQDVVATQNIVNDSTAIKTIVIEDGDIIDNKE